MTDDDLARASARKNRYWPLFMTLSPHLKALIPQAEAVDAVDARERARERAREAEWAFKMLAPLLVPNFQDCGVAEAQQITMKISGRCLYEAVLQVPFLNKDAPDVRSALHKRLRLPTRTEYDEANEHYLSVYVFAPLLREEAERLWEKEAKRMRKQGKLPLKKTGTEHYRKALEILAKKRGTTVGYLEKRMQYHFKNLGLKFKLERKLRPPPGFESDLEKDEVLKWFDERDALCEQYLKALRVAPRADGFYVERFDPATGTHVNKIGSRSERKKWRRVSCTT